MLKNSFSAAKTLEKTMFFSCLAHDAGQREALAGRVVAVEAVEEDGLHDAVELREEEHAEQHAELEQLLDEEEAVDVVDGVLEAHALLAAEAVQLAEVALVHAVDPALAQRVEAEAGHRVGDDAVLQQVDL